MEEQSLLKLLGNVIRSQRKEMKLSQESLAKKIDGKKDKSYICNIESGAKDIRLTSLDALASALGLRLWELMKIVDDVSAQPDALRNFLSFIKKAGCEIKEEELSVIERIKVNGSPPKDKDMYLLLWLLLKKISNKGVPEKFKVEISKADGEIIGKFTVHLD
ncbi:helix-turn-helix domain-containing protein [Desulfocucumis palustris]|nr:helix-turn-helix transcriptional regulator [Desulfocucumis palustris]